MAQQRFKAGEVERQLRLRDELAQRLEELLPGRVHLNGHPVDRLPNTLNVSIEGLRALTLLAELPGLAASAGSACHAGQDTASPVLTAMGLPADVALSAIRLSLGRWTTPDEVDQAAAQVAKAALNHPAKGI